MPKRPWRLLFTGLLWSIFKKKVGGIYIYCFLTAHDLCVSLYFPYLVFCATRSQKIKWSRSIWIVAQQDGIEDNLRRDQAPFRSKGNALTKYKENNDYFTAIISAKAYILPRLSDTGIFLGQGKGGEDNFDEILKLKAYGFQKPYPYPFLFPLLRLRPGG